MILDFDIRKHDYWRYQVVLGSNPSKINFFLLLWRVVRYEIFFFCYDMITHGLVYQFFVRYEFLFLIQNFSKFSKFSERSTKMNKSSLSSLKVSELKDMCRRKNLKVSGRKADLIERLETIEHESSSSSLDSSRLKSCMGHKVFDEFHIPSNMALLG